MIIHTRRQRLAIISVTAGQGHFRAAEAVRQTAEKDFGNLIDARHMDALELASPPYRAFYRRCYRWMVTGDQWVWRLGYHGNNRPGLPTGWAGLALPIECILVRRLRRWLTDFNPDRILCTHYLPLMHLAHVGGALGAIPRWGVITDHDCHGWWVQPGARGWFVADPEVADQVARLDGGRGEVQCTGIPVHPGFAPGEDPIPGRPLLGLAPAALTALLIIGKGRTALGVRHVASLVSCLPRLRLVVVAGDGPTDAGHLRGLARKHPERLLLLGHQRDLSPIIAASDVVISKSGGMITSECLAIGRPLIVVGPIPGQEEANAAYLLLHGAGLRADQPTELCAAIAGLIVRPDRLRLLQTRARCLGRPQAAGEILDHLFTLDHQDPATYARGPTGAYRRTA